MGKFASADDTILWVPFQVLRRLEYVNTDGVVSLKGRFAAHINSADEIVLTELVFEGTFRNLTPTQAAALISCFVWQVRNAFMRLGLGLSNKRLGALCCETAITTRSHRQYTCLHVDLPTFSAARIWLYQEKGAAAQSSRVREDLQQPLAALKDVARRVAKVCGAA